MHRIRVSDRKVEPVTDLTNFSVSGARPGAENGSTHQLADRWASRVADLEAVLRAWIEAEPDLALSEMCHRLGQQGVAIKSGALWHQLNKWKLTFKKNPARQRARSRGRAAGAKGMDRGPAHDERGKARVHR